MRQWLAGLLAELETIMALMAAGETEAVEARSKAVCAFLRAVEGVSLLEDRVRQQPLEQDVETMRAALELRIAQFINADRTIPIPQEPDQGGD